MKQIDHFYLDDSKFSPNNWFTSETLIQRAIIGAPTPAVFIELGTHRGRSAAYTAVEIMRSGKDISLFTFDISEMLHISAKDNLKSFPFVHPVLKDSTEAASLFEDASVDFLFMDADHHYEKLVADLDAWLPKMRIGSVIAGDDFWWTDLDTPDFDPEVPKFGFRQMRKSFPVARAVHERFPEYDLIVTQNWAKWWVVLR